MSYTCQYLDCGVSNFSIRYLYHISDIHLRNHNRHEEYRQVFEQLYSQLAEEPPGLIVLTGDIVHSKSQISPQLIIELREFLTRLCEIMPVIMIAGNHDLNLSNKDIPDTLTSILHKVELPQLHYLKKSGFYIWNNICFTVMSVLDYPLIKASEIPQKVLFPNGAGVGSGSGVRSGAGVGSEAERGNNGDGGLIPVALLHATLHGSRIATSHVALTSDKYKASDFEGYRAVLLGDIHLHQYLNAEKTIAYAGSLVQQSFGEQLSGHGYLKWDLGGGGEKQTVPRVTSKLVEVHNDWGFINLHLKDDKIGPEKLRYPPCKQLRVKIRILDGSSDIKVAEDYLRGLALKDYVVKQQIIIPYSPELRDPRENLPKIMLDNDEVPNLCNPEYQEQLMREYLAEQVEPDQVEALAKMHGEFGQQLDLAEETIQSRWHLESLEFNNVLTFKGETKLDFTQYHGIVGIFGPNFSGKSNLLDILLFGLFDRCSRGEREDLITAGETSMYVKVRFRIGDNKYLIHRYGKVQKGGKIKIDVIFSMINSGTGGSGAGGSEGGAGGGGAGGSGAGGSEDEVVVEEEEVSRSTASASVSDLTGENRYGTNREISRLLGSYEDFVLTTLRLQEGLVGNLIRLSNSQRKDRLIELLKLDVFDQYHKTANEELRSTKKSLEIYQRELSQLAVPVAELEIELVGVLEEIIETRKRINFSKLEQDKLRVRLTELNTALQPVNMELARQEYIPLSEVDPAKIKNHDGAIEELHEQVKSYQDQMKPLYYKMTEEELEENIELYRQTIEKDKTELSGLEKGMVEKETLLRGFRKTRAKYREELEDWEDLIAKKTSLGDWLARCQESNVKLLGLKYDPKCEYCMNNVFVKDAIQCRDDFETTKARYDRISAKVTELNEIRLDLREVEKEMETLQEELRNSPGKKIAEDLMVYESELRRLIDDLGRVRTNLKIERQMAGSLKELNELKEKREKLWKDWEAYQKMIEIKEHRRRKAENEHLNMEIERLEEQNRRARKDQTELEPVLISSSGREQRIRQQLEQANQWQEKVDALRPRKELLELYVKCFCKDGLPKFLIGKYLPAFERVVNLILEDLVEFRIQMEICEKKWNIYVVYADGRRNVDLCSGYEKFMIDVATKVALQNLSQISQPQFMVIDEGFGSLDNNNIHSVGGLFDYLRSHFQYVLLITHVEVIKDEVDRQLEVHRSTGGWSKIELDRATPKGQLTLSLK